MVVSEVEVMYFMVTFCDVNRNASISWFLKDHDALQNNKNIYFLNNIVI